MATGETETTTSADDEKTETVTVHYWPPSKRSLFGHASLSLPTGTYISWCPDNNITEDRFKCDAKKDRKLVDDKESHDNLEEFKIKLTTEQVNKIGKWWNEFKNNDENKYEAMKKNCSTVVFLALKEVNLKLKDLEVYDNHIWMPDGIKALAQALGKGIDNLTETEWENLKKDCSLADRVFEKLDKLANVFVSWIKKEWKKFFGNAEIHPDWK